MTHQNLKEQLALSLVAHGLDIVSREGKMICLKGGYTIEIEGSNLYKLIHDRQVVAPFSDVEELCHFIKMDMQLNAP